MRTCPTDPWLSVSVICVADPLLSISVRHRSRLERGGRRNHGEMIRGMLREDADQAGLGSLDSFKSRTALVHCIREH